MGACNSDVNNNAHVQEEIKFSEKEIVKETIKETIIVKEVTKENIYGSGGWLPDAKTMDKWRGAIFLASKFEHKSDDDTVEYKHAYGTVTKLAEIINNHPNLTNLVDKMIAEDAILHPSIGAIGSPQRMLMALDYIMSKGPQWHEGHLIGIPMAALFTGVNATLSGQAVFRNEIFGAGLTAVLKEWGSFLYQQSSFPKDNGWLSPEARKKWEPVPGMWKYELSDNPYWPNWNVFFARFFSDEYAAKNRAIAGQGNHNVIISPNDGSAFRWRDNIQLSDTFWFKDMPYSITDILGTEYAPKYAQNFVGGKIFQTFLDPFNYHRWNAPVAGTVVVAHVLQGLYFSKLIVPDIDGATTASCPYLTEVNARGIVIIDTSGYANIGLVCCIPIGMGEVSSIVFNQKIIPSKTNPKPVVQKSDELGNFAFGGSSFAIMFEDVSKYKKELIFTADHKLEGENSNLFPKDAPPPSPTGAGIFVKVNMQIGYVIPSVSAT